VRLPLSRREHAHIARDWGLLSGPFTHRFKENLL
jgi:hypothetical protein